MKKKPANLRENYTFGVLRRRDMKSNPFDQFSLWFSEALSRGIKETNAMVLSTVSGFGIPSSRVVLLKYFSEEGFIFYTNYTSRKAKEINENPHVSLVFQWLEMERQIRVQGVATRSSLKEDDNYFRSRPEGSRLGAWVSEQSKIITSREELDTRLEMFRRRFEGTEIPRPEHWGGFIVKPFVFEFWQGRENRLHDRFEYRVENGIWTLNRLAP